MARDGRAEVGVLGESLTAAHLEQLGYQIVARNQRVGRLEIDLIARLGEMLVFCEVRTRSSRLLMEPIESIDPRKRARIRRAAAQWLAQSRTHAYEVRFDAASVVLTTQGPELVYYEDAF